MENRQSSDVGVIFLVGPTATGKSEVALHLARVRGAAILCLDSMQVYRGLDIGTGKPSAAERSEIPHGGLDLVEPGQDFSVADYVEHARRFLAQHPRTIIVGGTGLYYRALTRGLCEAPRGSDALRGELAALPIPLLQERLQRLDPATYATVDRKNPRRLVRAIEVAETTGRPLSEWQQENQPPLLTQYRSFYLHRERNDLRDRIAERVRKMLAAGWENEVRGLLSRLGWEWLRRSPAIGYAEIARHEGNREVLPQRIIDATRQYAKRQQTWFKRETNYTLIEIDPDRDSASVAERIL